jgi:FLVCR family feline leukemia virus subgroup C receptor-related protein
VQIGICGFCGLVAGMVGSLFWPFIAEKTKLYRTAWMVMCGSAALSLPVFCYFARSSKFSFVEIDLIAIFLNVNTGGMFSVAFEFAAEITFPISESLSSGVALASAQFFGFIFIESLTFSNASADSISITICIIAFLGFIASCFVKNTLKRFHYEEEIKQNSEQSLLDT